LPEIGRWDGCGLEGRGDKEQGEGSGPHWLYFMLFQPVQVRTGSRGYLGNWGLVAARAQRRKVEPRSEVMVWAWVQEAQSPG
jgi:hypothetical protein